MSGYGDLPTCIADVKEVVSDAEEALADFKKGDPADIMAGIKEIADIITVLKKAETDCKMDKYKEEGEHKLGDLQTCMNDIMAIRKDAEKAIADFKSGNMTAGVADVSDMLK